MKKTILGLSVSVLVLSAVCAVIGLLSSKGAMPYSFLAITGESVSIYGTGLYAHDSVSMVAQGLASDFITLVIAIPVTLVALVYSQKNSFRGALVLSGMLGYFLYTYASYAFLWNYNALFIVYVMIMSLSFFAFVLMMTSFVLKTIKTRFKDPFKPTSILVFEILVSVMVGLLWLSKLAPTWFSAAVPVGLEHYTTLVIQALDLGFIVPTAVLSTVLLIQRKPLGYLLSSIIVIKGIALLTSITAMAINMNLAGVSTSLVEIGIFGTLDLFGLYALVRLISQTQNQTKQSN